MPLNPVLLDLLIVWEERQTAAAPIPPEELCRDHPELLAEVRHLIQDMLRLNPLLALVEPPGPPTVLGFDLFEEIGRGGMGVVYRAADRNLDREVAVKIPFRTHGSMIPRVRFEREARALAKLRHPNIVSVYSAGLTGDTPYLAMEYVPGGSLAERRGEVAKTPSQTADLVEKVARAVGFAHAAGIVHRDLKPSNILLDTQGQPLVSDFGVAALLGGESISGSSEETPNDRPPTQTRITRTGRAAGTPAYSAPEQATGAITAATDVWSLGVLLHELLSGIRPTAATAPDPDAVTKTIPGLLGRRLADVVRRCLRRVPGDRYENADALANALAAIVRPSRRGWLRTGLVAGAAALVAGVPVGLFTADPYRRFCWRTSGLTRRLERGEAVELIDLNGTSEPDYFVHVGHGATGTERLDGAWVVSSTAFSLLELVARLPPGCRVRVELRHNHSSFDANPDVSVGVVFGVSGVVDGDDQRYFASFVSFNDIGGPGVVRVGAMWPIRKRGAVHPSQYYGENASKRYQIPATRPAPFRVVEFSLPPDDTPIVWSGPPSLSLAPVRAAHVRGTRGFVDTHPPELVDRIEGGYSHRIGLIVSGGAIAARSVLITPPSDH